LFASLVCAAADIVIDAISGGGPHSHRLQVAVTAMSDISDLPDRL
jgi:hypothetical protein